MEYASIGSISSGTLRDEDLLDAYAYELEDLVQRNADTWCSDAGRKQRDGYMALIHEARELDVSEDPDDTAPELVQELADALQDFAPDYTYFGAHEGDGADFGFWLPSDWQQAARDDGVLEVSDLSEVPDNHRGHVLHVNDHSNATLYGHNEAGERFEIWSVV